MKNFILVLSAIAFIFFSSCMRTDDVDDSTKIKEENVTLRGDGGSVSPPHRKWSSQFKITASDAEDYDNFGCRVSISGDYAIVGAYNENGSGINRGAAYIFRRTGTNLWDSGLKITASGAADYDRFGYSVSISDDYAVIGAIHQDGGGIDSGAIYIYRRIGDNIWDAGTKIYAPDADDGDLFGCSVSISGDYVLVGAREEDGSGIDRGAAYIYHRIGNNIWDNGIKIIAPDAQDYDWFGFSDSISNDYAIITARNEDSKGTDRGAAYIFKRTGTNTWDTGTKIISPNTADNELFGQSGYISGSYAIVGTYLENNFGTDRGAAYIFRRTGATTWDSGTRILAPDAEDYDWFGFSVSISGDYAIVGAYKEDGIGVGFDCGAAYLYHRTGINAWDAGTKISASDARDSDNFGIKVSISGEYTIVAAISEDGSGIDRGAAYIFK